MSFIKKKYFLLKIPKFFWSLSNYFQTLSTQIFFFLLWNPFYSFMGSALLKGLDRLFLRFSYTSLCFGISFSSFFTFSHLSNIIGKTGSLFVIEPSRRLVRNLFFFFSLERIVSQSSLILEIPLSLEFF